MSLITHYKKGYGFRIWASEPNLCEFIKKHRKTVETLVLGKEILAWVDKGNVEGIKEHFFDFEATGGGSGIYGIVADVIGRENGICISYEVADEYEDNDDAVMFVEKLPWFMNEKERSLTAEELDKIFTPYVKELNTSLTVGYIEGSFCD